ncbi:MAG: alpha/beta fold hydrolase [Deltaproteobacteria bacterium]|nr:alpha/beta fold hydrolase [Nannocystaceae bacterium]
MVRTHELELPAVDGRVIAARLFCPNVRSRGSVVVHGATAVAQRYYEDWARHLASRGLTVLTYDYRGVGRSRSLPLRDDPVTMQDWIDDAAIAQRWLSDHDRFVPLVAVGHSFGGQIAASLRPEANAIVTVGAQGGFVGRFPGVRRHWFGFVMRTAIPQLVARFGYLPGWAGLGEDLPAGVALQWARWCTSKQYLFSELPELREQMARWAGPMLALSFDDDGFAPLGNVRWLLQRFASASIEHHHLSAAELRTPSIGHFGFFRAWASDALWPLIDDFVARLGVRPIMGESERVHADLAWGR